MALGEVEERSGGEVMRIEQSLLEKKSVSISLVSWDLRERSMTAYLKRGEHIEGKIGSGKACTNHSVFEKCT